MSEHAIARNKVNEITEFSVPAGMVNLNEISKMLMDQMKLVEKNPGAIPQAECAVMIAGRIVDIAKTQVSQAQAVNDLIRTKNSI